VLDVPYFGMAKQQYSNKKRDLSNMDERGWTTAIKAVARSCSRAQKADDLPARLHQNLVQRGERQFKRELTYPGPLTGPMFAAMLVAYGLWPYGVTYEGFRAVRGERDTDGMRGESPRKANTFIRELLEFMKSAMLSRAYSERPWRCDRRACGQV
jgi:hypothetical protein